MWVFIDRHRVNLSAILIALFFGISVNAVQASEEDELKDVLLGMGYENIQLHECQLSFSRRVEPTDENNGYFKYEQFLDLNDLKEFSSLKLQFVVIDGRLWSLLNVNFDDAVVHEQLATTRAFRSWISANHEGSEWTYTHPNRHDDLTADVESRFRKHFPNFARLNRRVDHSKFGPSTVLVFRFELPSESAPPLWAFKSALINYAIGQKCSIDD